MRRGRTKWDYFACGCRFKAGTVFEPQIWEPCKLHEKAERLNAAAIQMNAQLDMETPDNWNRARADLKAAIVKQRKAKS